MKLSFHEFVDHLMGKAIYIAFLNNEAYPNSWTSMYFQISKSNNQISIHSYVTGHHIHNSQNLLSKLLLRSKRKHCAWMHIIVGSVEKPTALWRKQMLQILTFRQLCKIHHWCKNIPKLHNYWKFKCHIATTQVLYN